jgi:1-acyl-sn-glycerol-3-phosphate acyltransferase
LSEALAPPGPPRLGLAKGVLALGFAAATLVPAQLLLDRVRPRARPHLPRLFHRILLRGLGLDVTLHGRPARGTSVMFVANHLSWLDVPVLGSRLLGNFVAKTEVGAMGPVAWFADLQRTIYVDRGQRRRTADQRNAITDRLADGGNVLLFPEGTTGDGVHVLPFNSSLFAAVADAGDALVQPVSLAYTRIRGLPVTRRRIAEVAWTGDTGIGEHALGVLRLGRIDAAILCHDPVAPADFADRKALARHCETTVADGYAALMRGRA